MTNLKPHQYYEDLYDQGTIDECKYHERQPTKIKGQLKTKEEIEQEFNKVVDNVIVIFIKGERYAKRAKTIEEWMSRDKEKDEKLEKAHPMKVGCFHCSSEAKVISKDLWDRNGTDVVLFMYECITCGKRRAFYEDGVEWLPKPHVCPNCQIDLNEENKKTEDKLTTIYSCSNCDYKDIIDLDLRPEPKTKKKTYTLADKKKYCLSKEEGDRYIDSMFRLKHLKDLKKELEEKEKNKNLYDRVSNLKKLKITQLKELLQKELEKNQYINLQFGKPEIGKEVVIEFTVNDNKDNREEYDSRIGLTKLIKKTLENTNWRLMSDGISYRLGILTGRLKGFESEEDLIKIIK